ncbi:hypothetical protein G3570_12260 [Balneolaceae bacterium YR4-1]|uniref:Uncharacterized protein n=1 Tax=Halalkalibaculum roseum TaxID=2709311 RepID=A0A6M1SWS9_9BACT|nr:hypothetical protein [Halalkalibaculum roseum]NGP77412.1 hypothetical protein [Halalkalibaculum roseum]
MKRSSALKGCYLTLFLAVIYATVWAAPQENGQAEKPDLFASDEPLEIRLEGDVGELMDDRGEDPDYHLMKLHYNLQNTPEKALDLRVRVRGNFRRLEENCDKPPLKFNFKDHPAPDTSIFAGQKELKLVVPCDGEKYVVREYLTYKLYNLITDYSFKVRQVRFSYHDSEKNKFSDPVFAFLIEDQNLLAERKVATLYDRNNLRPESIDEQPFLRLSVFAYLIGNTDWSVQFQHNLKVLFLEKEKVFVAVPYDFDLVGLVSSPYAKPAEALRLRSVRERVYRGHCMEDLSPLDPIFDEFRKLKPEMYALYTGNELLEEDYIDWTLDYFDDFYKIINNRKKRDKVFSYPCNQYGTGNVVISGMDN